MNIVYIIGNGFDINFGYASSYSDIYKKYVKRNDSDSELITKFKKLITSEAVNWGDFEMAIPQFGRKLDNEEELIECIEDFQLFTMSYLREEDEKIKSSIGLPEKNIIRSLLTDIKTGLTPNEQDLLNYPYQPVVNAITFNYTYLLDDIFATKQGVVHIHGEINNNQGFFGLDSVEQLGSMPYNLSEKAKRRLVKPIFNQSYDKSRVESAEKLISNANVIYIYGASLGPSDLTWRNRIVDWLRSSKRNQLIIYEKELSVEKKITPQRIVDIKEDYVERLCKTWEIDDVKLQSQIHVPYGFNMFDIDKIREKISLGKSRPVEGALRK